MNIQSGIYEILNTVNGKRYIGSATKFRKRFAAHRCCLRQGGHHSSPLQHAWDKYGEKVFVFRPLLICAPGMLTFYEDRAFKSYRPEYNTSIAADNAMRGRHHSSETKAKIGAAGRGRIVSAAARARISAAGKGRRHSEEERKKRGLTLLGNKRAVGSKGHVGLKAPPAVIAKLVASHLGKHPSLETRAKMSASGKARWAKLREAQ